MPSKTNLLLPNDNFQGVVIQATVLSVARALGAMAIFVVISLIYRIMTSQPIPMPRIDLFSPLGFAIAASFAVIIVIVLFVATLIFGYPLALIIRNMDTWRAVATCAIVGGLCYGTVYYFTDGKGEIGAVALGAFYGTLYGSSFIKCRGIILKELPG